jgi:hypothetical protein
MYYIRTISVPLPLAETALREFYRPYNELLAKLMEDEKFKWETTEGKVRTAY